MEKEYNEIPYDNLATTFDNSPNNIQTSDELEADAVYTNKMGTSYSISKALTKAATIVGFSVTTGVGGVLLMQNTFVTAPTISDNTISVSKELDELSYSFTIKNEKNLKCLFEIKSSEKTFVSLDVSPSNTYEGKVENIGYNIELTYKLSYSNNLDYSAILWQGTLTTISEVI